MNIPDLEAFIAVAESGSIVGASARLHLTQPAVSRRIQNLEQSLGTALLDRNSKPPRPTAAGRTVYELARRLLSMAEDLRHAVSPDNVPSGEFRVGVTNSLGPVALARSVQKLRAAFPRIQLHAITAWSSILIKELQGAAIDAGVLVMSESDAPPAGFNAERLGFEDVTVVAARTFPLKSCATLAEIAAQPWVLDREGCSLRNIVRSAFNAERLPFQTAVEAAGLELQLELVAHGLGLGLVTTRLLARHRLRQSVRPIAVKGFRPKGAVWFLSQAATGRLAAPIAAFRQSLVDVLAEKDPAQKQRSPLDAR